MTDDHRMTTGAEHLVDRLERLTSSELRLLSLATPGGLRHADLAATLGVTPGNVASAMQRIRRKLAVPRRVDLGSFTEAHPNLKVEVTARLADGGGGARRTERRQFHVLRATIDDLAAVAVRARARVDTVERARGRGDDERRSAELDTLRRIVEIVDDAVEAAIAVARRPGDRLTGRAVGAEGLEPPASSL